MFFKRFVVLKKTVLCVQAAGNLFLLAGFFGLLGEKDSVDVGQDSTVSDGDSAQELVQFFVVADGQLEMSWDDSLFLVVTGSVTSQLQDFSRQVF